jgi:LuxR family maltose regulon positive regulatory protein
MLRAPAGPAATERGRRSMTEQDDRRVQGLASRVSLLAPSDELLRLPPLPADTIRRPAVVDRLTDAEAPPVVVVSAPAGYGKSTLIAEWAEADERPFAYVTLTARANDPAVLVAYLARALDAAHALDVAALADLGLPGADPATVLLPRLGATLRALPGPIVLALDDVHVLHGPRALPVLETLVQQVPAGSALVLAARTDPALPLRRLQAARQLAYIGPADLALDAEGARALLAAAGVACDPPDAQPLVERAEGWPAGLYLAALSCREQADPVAAARVVAGDDRLIGDFLRDEYLRVLPAETVELLTRTSVLDRLSGPLCDAVLGATGSGVVLARLAASNLFLSPIDRQGEWYRYHHLFRDLLRAELRRREPELEPTLHAHASEWCEHDGDIDGAVEHAIAARQTDRATRLMWRSALVYLGTGRGATVDGWLDAFAPDARAEDPVLCLLTAWRCVTGSSPTDVDRWTATAEELRFEARLPDGTEPRAVVATLQALVGRRGLAAMGEDATRAVALDDTHSRWVLPARILEGVALRLAGDPERATECFEDVVRRSVVMPATTSVAYAQLAMIDIADGRWAAADATADLARRLADEYGLVEQPPQASVHAMSALLHARHGRDAEAQRDWHRARHLVSRLGAMLPWLAIEARLVLARTAALLGDLGSMRVLVDEARTLVGDRPGWDCLAAPVDDVASLTPARSEEVGVATPPLTTAELRVLRYLPTHLNLAAIGADLFVSRNTVKTQAIAIYRKLGVSTREAAVARAQALGLLPALGTPSDAAEPGDVSRAG